MTSAPLDVYRGTPMVSDTEARSQVYRVADRMLPREPDITRLFDRLVRAELVERTRCEADRQVVWVSLTTKGRKLVNELDRPVMTLHRKQLGRLGVRKLRLLSELLEEAIKLTHRD